MNLIPEEYAKLKLYEAKMRAALVLMEELSLAVGIKTDAEEELSLKLDHLDQYEQRTSHGHGGNSSTL